MNNARILQLFNKLSIYRQISTTKILDGKKNFRKFPILNKRGTRIFKEQQNIKPHPKIPIDNRGVRGTGYILNAKYKEMSEKIPQLIVPDLTDCGFKPYVSYRTTEVYQPEFTSLDLFKSVYSEKIIQDYNTNKLDEKGESIEPSKYEKLTADEAWLKARRTGSDIFE